MRISDWSSDVCSSDLIARCVRLGPELLHQRRIIAIGDEADVLAVGLGGDPQAQFGRDLAHPRLGQRAEREAQEIELRGGGREQEIALVARRIDRAVQRSEEHTSELQSLMRISYAVFCLKKKNKNTKNQSKYTYTLQQIKNTK